MRMILKGLAGVAALGLVLALAAGRAPGGERVSGDAQVFFSPG